MVRGAGLESLMSCWLIVEAPDVGDFSSVAVRSARAVARRSTPECWRKRLSSALSVAVIKMGAISARVQWRE